MSFDALQTAIYAKLTGDTVLTGMLSTSWGVAAIFSDVPQENADDAAYYPFISFGPEIESPFNDKSVLGESSLSQIDVWTRSGDYIEGKQIVGRVRSLLDRQDMVVSGKNHVTTDFESCTFSIDPDGSTRRGMMQFRTLQQEA